jgi:hypothetical protein
MRLVEGHDLDGAFQQVTEEKINFDQRINGSLEQFSTTVL